MIDNNCLNFCWNHHLPNSLTDQQYNTYHHFCVICYDRSSDADEVAHSVLSELLELGGRVLLLTEKDELVGLSVIFKSDRLIALCTIPHRRKREYDRLMIDFASAQIPGLWGTVSANIPKILTKLRTWGYDLAHTSEQILSRFPDEVVTIDSKILSSDSYIRFRHSKSHHPANYSQALYYASPAKHSSLSRQFQLRPTRLFLFDVVGVLATEGNMSGKMLWLMDRNPSLIEQIANSDLVARLETGAIHPEKFLSAAVSKWNIPLSSQEFREAMETWVNSLMPEAIVLLKTINHWYPTACLTNTDPIQWPFISTIENIGTLFCYSYLSYEIGYRKPDERVFSLMCSQLDINPREILYFDDRSENVESAKNYGLQAYQAQTPTQIKNIVKKFGMEFDWVN